MEPKVKALYDAATELLEYMAGEATCRFCRVELVYAKDPTKPTRCSNDCASDKLEMALYAMERG